MSKRISLLVGGATLLAGGLVLSAVGGAGLAFVGTDSTVGSGTHAVSTPTHALVTEAGDIGTDGADFLGDPTLKLAVRGSQKPVFIGVGPAAQVDRYLSGASVDLVTDVEVNPFQLTTERKTGTRSLTSPLDETFWVAQADGDSAASTRWKMRDGRYRVIVMNADGSPGVAVDGSLAVRVPYLTPIGTTVFAGGLLAVLVGGVLVIVGVRSDTGSTSAPAATPADQPSRSDSLV